MTIIEFPSDKPSPVPSGDIAARTAANSSAFLRLESPIRDAALIAEIVMGLIMEAHEDDDLDRTSFFRIDKAMSSLLFVASAGRFTGYDPG
jgi:hypothetical protein